jgi:hypothetical protein
MADNPLRRMLEDASADVPSPDMTAATVTGVRRRRARRRVVGVAAAAVTVGATTMGLPVLQDAIGGRDGDVAGQGVHVAEPAPVDDTFECEHTVKVSIPERLPTIYGDGPDFGTGQYGAERYEVLPTENGRRELQVGDAAGSLTARVILRPFAGGGEKWEIDRYERCTGPNSSEAPVDGRFRLGAHGRPIPEPPEFIHANPVGEAPKSSVVPLDDRPFYNRIGVVDHRTLYAYETDSGVSITTVEGGRPSDSTANLEAGKRPLDTLGQSFIPADDPPVYDLDRPASFAGWTYYTFDDATLTGRLSDGREIAADTFRGDDWKGALHVLLVPAGELETITLDETGRQMVFRSK